MPALRNEVLKANKEFVEGFGDRGALSPQPIRKVAVLTCMDARIDTFAISGMNIGDMNVIRNAGGRASDDAVRSLLISAKFLGSTDWFIIQHTECGMESVDDSEIAKAFEAHEDHEGNFMFYDFMSEAFYVFY